MKTRVLVVDDSALARDMVAAALSRADDIEVVGMAADPILARRQISLLHPDVVTLDVEMPRMDGLAFLDQIMRLRPMSVVMVSTLTSKGSGTSLKALALGAVDVVPKPVSSGAAFESLSAELVEKVRLAGIARVRASQRTTRPVSLLLPCSESLIVAVGGEGSVQAMADLLHGWPADAPPLILMPAIGVFDPVDLASVLDGGTAAHVCAAQPGMVLSTGVVCVFAPSQGMTVCAHHGGSYAVAPSDLDRRDADSLIGAADCLLHDVADIVGEHAVAVALSSATEDGASGVAAVIKGGGMGVVQDRASSMFHTLADAVIRQGHGHHVVTLSRMARDILSARQGAVA